MSRKRVRNLYNKPQIEKSDDMTAMLLEKNRVEYLKGMENYLNKLKSMPTEDAKKIALDSLYQSGVLTKSGKLTAHYRNNLK